MNIAIIGAGYWGKNLVRVFYSLSDDVKLKYVCDLDEKKLAKIKKMYPDVQTIADANIIFSDPEISAVVVSTPASAHYELIKKTLLSGKHVLVEKPMTRTLKEADELVTLAKEKDLVLMVDHTFLYTPAVKKIKHLIENNELGKINYIDSERINLGLIQPDVNVIYDLAAHDISIFNYILGEWPSSVMAFGKSFITKGTVREVEEVAHINLEYPSGVMAHVHVSWLSPVKLRKMLVGGSKKMIIYNDVEPSEKIKIVDQGVDIDFGKENSFFPIYRSGEISIPKLSEGEALIAEAQEFIQSIKENRSPLTCGESGLKTVQVLEKATQSMRENGIKIYF